MSVSKRHARFCYEAIRKLCRRRISINRSLKHRFWLWLRSGNHQSRQNQCFGETLQSVPDRTDCLCAYAN